jgi:hypothetical protein
MEVIDNQARRNMLSVPLSTKTLLKSIADRVRRKRQRLPPNGLIENARLPNLAAWLAAFSGRALPIRY